MKVRRKRNGNDLSDLTTSSLQRSRPWTDHNVASQFTPKPLSLQAKSTGAVNLLSRVSQEQSPLELSPDTSQLQQPVHRVFRKLATRTDEIPASPSSKPFWLQRQTTPNHLTASPVTLQREADNEEDMKPKPDIQSMQVDQSQGSDRQLQLSRHFATSMVQRDTNRAQLHPQPRSGLIQRTEDEDTTSTSSEQTSQPIPPDRPLPPLPSENEPRSRRGAISGVNDHLRDKTEVGIWATDTLKLGGRGTDLGGAAIESVALTGVLQDINGNASRLEGAVEGENWLNASQILQKIGQSFVNLGKTLKDFGPIGTLLSSLSLFNYITSCIDTTKQRNLLKAKAIAMGIDFGSETDPKAQIQEKAGQIDTDLADAFVHGYSKLSRRIPRLVARIVNGFISLSTLLLDLISGGMTLLVTQSIRTFSGVLMAIDSLSRMFKGIFKKYKKTKGKHRLKSATTLMNRARNGNMDAAEAVINLLKSFSADDEYSALRLVGGDTKRALLNFFGASTQMTQQQCIEELQNMDEQSYEWMTENLFAQLRSYV